MPTFRESLTIYQKSLGAAASAQLAALGHETKERIEREQGVRRGIKPTTTTAVDQNLNKRFEDVKPDGMIVMTFDYREEIVAFAFQELRARSPLGPDAGGHYRDSQFVMLDGTGLPALAVPKGEQLRNVKQVIITNPVPYSRKLEVGKTKDGRSFARSVDPHIFEGAMRATRREFSGAGVKISFNYVDLSGAYALRGGGKGGSVRYPAIIIDFR
jgi:hypothetical protein